jgi:phosphoribosyl-ATP pyrophosphohydrolase
MADLWFHCMIALTHYDATALDVIAELDRRAGTSGLQEKAMRKLLVRENEEKCADYQASISGTFDIDEA